MTSPRDQTLLQEIFENSPAFIAVLHGPEFIFEKCNPKYYEIVGHRDIIGKKLIDAIPEIVGQPFIDILTRVLETGLPFYADEIPVDLMRKPGGTLETRYVDLVYQRIMDHEGKLNNILAHGVDVTDKVNARMKQEEADRLFRTFADAMPHMAFIADPVGNITFFNKRWYQYIDGMEGTEGWGWKEKPIHHPDDLQRTIDRWTHSLKTGEPYEIEYRLRRHDGVYRWHAGRAVPYKNHKGEITSWIGTNTDIHEMKEHEGVLKEIQVELEASLQARDEFLSIASHELRTPLTALKLQSQSLHRKLEKGMSQEISMERLKSMVGITERQIGKLTHLVDDMLDLSRIQSGKLTYKFESADLVEILKDVTERMEEQFSVAGSRLNVRLPEKLILKLDRFRFEQVFVNLLTNALKYGKGSPVHVELSESQNKALLSVQDEGIGIAPENLELIFNRFERAVSANEISGLGLGLYITQQIVESHGGKIWVESELEKGSIFKVELPL